MSKPTRKSNILQTLLIFAVVFLGMRLLFKDKPEQGLDGLKAEYTKDFETYDSARHSLEEVSKDPSRVSSAKATLDQAENAQKQAQAEYDRIATTKNPPPVKLQLEAAKKVLDQATILRDVADKKYRDYSNARPNLDAARGALIAFTPTYANALRAERKDALTAEARMIESRAAEITYDLAIKDKNFNEALTAYNAYHSLYKENGSDEYGKAAAAAMPKIAEQANDIAKSNTGPTRYGYAIIDGLVKTFHSYWLAAVLLAIIVRAMVWPLASKQMMGFKRMALLQPMMKELQQKYQGPELNQRMMALYRKYGINPLAGCWPLLIQMPFFLWVFYSMRQYQFEFHKGTFLWINPGAAAQNPGIFGANLGERDAPLVILYGISMVVSTLVSVNDPNSAKQARITGILMAVLFTGIMLFTAFPSAFVLYWTVLNILATAQSIFISRQPVPPLVERPDGGGQGSLFAGMMPKDGPTGNGGNGSSLGQTKTGAPVVHKPKGGKGKKR